MVAPSASVLPLPPDQEPARYRPWEQKDLLNRLKTFKPRNWFGRPVQINAVSCARHGWTNSGPENLTCEFCGECMDLPIRPKWSAQQVQKVSTEYADKLVSGHATSCPWRDTVCDAKLGKFPRLPARDVYVDFEQRYACLDAILHLPPLSQQAVEILRTSHRDHLSSVIQKQLHAKCPQQAADATDLQAVSDMFENLAEQGSDAFIHRACLLAACGWDAFQLSSLVGRVSPQQTAAGLPHGACEMQDGVLACGMCGARVGLWSFAHQPEVSTAQVGQPSGSGAPEAAPELQQQQARLGTNAGAEAATPARRESIRRDLSRSIAGGPTVSPSSNAASPVSPDQRPDYTSSLPPVPQTAASTSRPHAPFGSPLLQASFGSPLPVGSSHQLVPVSSALRESPDGGSAHRHAPFGSPLQAPAFGSGSAYDSPQFFTPSATLDHQALTAAPQSTFAFGALPTGTPASAFGTPASAFGTPYSTFGSPAFHTPAATPGVQSLGSPRSRKQASAFETPASSGGQDASAAGPFGAPVFGSGAALPAFGLAVFKSPPQSRSPSQEISRPPSASPLPATAAAAALPATPAKVPKSPTSLQPIGEGEGVAATAANPLSDAAATNDQPSGSKRKRVSGVEATHQPAASKQPRLHLHEDAAGTAGMSGQTFDLLKSHKSFCPWVAVSSEDEGASICGWQWCLASLAAHWDKDPSSVDAPPSEGRSQRLRQALASIRRD